MAELGTQPAWQVSGAKGSQAASPPETHGCRPRHARQLGLLTFQMSLAPKMRVLHNPVAPEMGTARPRPQPGANVRAQVAGPWEGGAPAQALERGPCAQRAPRARESGKVGRVSRRRLLWKGQGPVLGSPGVPAGGALPLPGLGRIWPPGTFALSPPPHLPCLCR